MAVKTEQIEKNLSKLTFEVDYEEFDKEINKVYRKNVGKINVQGFRKGKAPRAIIEKFYGASIFYEDAINALLQQEYPKALEESGLDAVGKPEIDVEDIKKGEPVVFVALVTTKPEVELGEYKGIETDKIEYTVTDEDIAKDLEASQKKNARLVPVEDRAAENGDIVEINFEGFVDGAAFEGGKGENYDLEIGSNTFIPGFEEQLIGAKTNDLVDVTVTFPEDYHAPDLAGKEAVFKVTVNDIKTRELPELDDDFASEVSEFDTMSEFKEDIRKRLEQNAENKAKSETENAVVTKVVENASVDIPDAMIEIQLDYIVNDMAQRLQYQGITMEQYLQMTNSTPEEFRAQFRQQAETQVKNTLVLEAIAKAENIEVGPEELELHLADMAKKYNMEIDKLKEMLPESEISNIRGQIKINKTIDMLVNFAVVK